jgi:hypothetical protein
MEGWEVYFVISEVINGVLVFGPDDMTEEEYLAWRAKKIADTNLYWKRVEERQKNMTNECRIIRLWRDWWRFVRKIF